MTGNSRIPREIEAETVAEQPFDASDPKQVNESRKRAGRKKREDAFFMETLMGIPQGRAWVWQELEAHNMWGNPLVKAADGTIDVPATFFVLGGQNEGKRLLAQVMEFPDLYVEMVKEAKGRK